MAQAKTFPIKESYLELVSLQRKQTLYRVEKRVIWLIELQKGKFNTRESLANYLGINLRIQERWIQRYISTGVEGLLSDASKT